MSSQIPLRAILAALVLSALNSFPAWAQENEKKKCEADLQPLKVAVIADEPFLLPVRARIMPAGNRPSYIFVAGSGQELLAWSDDAGGKLHVSYLESPSQAFFTLPLEAEEEVREFRVIDSGHVKIQTDHRILTLQIKR